MSVVVFEGDVAKGRDKNASRARLREDNLDGSRGRLVLDDYNHSSCRSRSVVKKGASGCASGELLVGETTKEGG
jgi:hypothetical protein